MAELVRVIFITAWFRPFYRRKAHFQFSVTFLLLAYFETFVVLGCASSRNPDGALSVDGILATQEE
jgi:hypothetical protein